MRWFQPKSALFWVYCATLLGGAIAMLVQLAPVLALTWNEVLVGLPFVAATLVVFGWLLLHLDRLRAHRPIRTVLVLGFLWGALAGPGIAIYANDHIMRVIQNLAGDEFAINWQAPISASIVEEGIKGLGVYAVAGLAKPLLSRPMHGLLLGGFVGLGFQVVEDLTYEANSGLSSAQGGAVPAILVGVVRLLAGVASHWMFTALAGIGIVTALARTDLPMAHRVRAFAAFYLLGCAMHFGWDAPDLTGFDALNTVGKAVLYVVVFAVVYAWVVRTERSWFRSIIPWAAARGIATPAELNTLVTRGSRRRARKAIQQSGPYNRRQLVQRQHWLMDQVQYLGVHQPSVRTQAPMPGWARD
ncbi:PrsW family intramembrane metalloprotease [Nocardia sp. NPDC052566]|uniref:PrsW family intramembrane metalloprotease n=1 Tax=Nocardia sp. NPDC052566 TaxID=3364330 RepID=UPI0037C568CF